MDEVEEGSKLVGVREEDAEDSRVEWSLAAARAEGNRPREKMK